MARVRRVLAERKQRFRCGQDLSKTNHDEFGEVIVRRYLSDLQP